jgi:zinc transporter ZupT
MDKTKEGLEVLWLAGASASFGVFASVGLTLLTIPSSIKPTSSQLSHSTREVLVTVLISSIVGTVVGLVGYFSAKKRRGDAVSELIKDMVALEPPDMSD